MDEADRGVSHLTSPSLKALPFLLNSYARLHPLPHRCPPLAALPLLIFHTLEVIHALRRNAAYVAAIDTAYGKASSAAVLSVMLHLMTISIGIWCGV